MAQPERDYEAEARRDLERLDPFDRWILLLQWRGLLIRQQARRLYLRLMWGRWADHMR